MPDRTPEQREQRRDLIFSSILLAFAVAWTVTVYYTVPPGRGFGVGPRAFPFYLGVALIGLSALLLITTILKAGPPPDTAGEDEPALAPIAFWPQMRIIASVFVVIGAYGYLMQNAGFVLATLMVVSFTLWVVVGVRRPLLVLGMSVGITGGSWLVFGKILGAYIPRGTWVSFF
jgi:hypothetical protein